MTFEFLIPKRIGRISASLQIAVVILLYLCTLALGYAEFQELGTVFSYPLSLSILFVPLYEEALFRGAIFENALKKLSPLKSIALVSLLFGIWHLKNIFWLPPELLARQVLYTGLIISPLCCWLTLRTKSIWPGVILHYLNNLSASEFLWHWIQS